MSGMPRRAGLLITQPESTTRVTPQANIKIAFFYRVHGLQQAGADRQGRQCMGQEAPPPRSTASQAWGCQVAPVGVH
eukprot:5150784-Pyramimonas_sp.AAC.1